MKQCLPLFLVPNLVVLFFVVLCLAACATPRFDSVPLKRLPPSGDELLELDSGRVAGRLASRLIEVPGEADLSVFAEATDPSAPLRVEVFRGDGTRVARGAAPLVLKHLRADRYVIVVRLARGATRVRLATVLTLHNPDARSGMDALPETATILTSGLPLHGRVDWFALDSTDHLAIETGAQGRLNVMVELPRRKGAVTMTMLAPNGTATEFSAGAPHIVDDTVEGRYIIRIRAAEQASADYAITAAFTPWDPDGARERAGPLSVGDVLELRGELNPGEGDSEDWFRFQLDRPALLVRDGARAATWARLDWFAGDTSDPVGLVPGQEWRLEAGPHFIRVGVDGGDGDPGRITYDFAFKLMPEVAVEAALLERFRRDGCVLVIDRGSEDRLRRGLDASIFRGDGAVARGVVEAVYRNTSRVRVGDPDCAFGESTRVTFRFFPRVSSK